jgi:hypothetical protein
MHLPVGRRGKSEWSKVSSGGWTLGDDTGEARPGTWVHMLKGLRHSIQAKRPVLMLLLPAEGASADKAQPPAAISMLGQEDRQQE